MTHFIIGLTGKKGAGKDTVARLIHSIDDTYRAIAFADPLKDAVAAMLLVPRSYLEDRNVKEEPIAVIGKSPRYMMQTLGTEWGRELIHPDLWVILASERIDHLLQFARVVITDVRFENEAEMIRKKGGIIVHIIRPEVENSGDAHASETGIEKKDEDYLIYNTSSLDELQLEVQGLYEHLESKLKSELDKL